MILFIIASRLVLSLIVSAAKGGEPTQDEGLYCRKALIESYQMKGMTGLEEGFYRYFNDPDMMDSDYGKNIYTRILSILFYFCGYAVQSARLVNIALSVFAFLAVFYLSLELLDEKRAMIASTIFAFFPSITLWSVMISIDISVILGLVLFLLALVKVMKKTSALWIAVLIVSFLIVKDIREYLAQPLILTACIGLSAKYFLALPKKYRIAITVSIIIIGGLGYMLFSEKIDKKMQIAMGILVNQQWNLSYIDDSGYLIYPTECYNGTRCGYFDILRGYLKGLAYVIFSPFPWKMGSNLQMAAYPQVMMWYFMLPFVVYGFFEGFKARPQYTTAVFSAVVIIISVLAFAQGNVGALFRHRDMIMPFCIIYFSYGLKHFLEVRHAAV